MCAQAHRTAWLEESELDSISVFFLLKSILSLQRNLEKISFVFDVLVWKEKTTNET